MLDLGCGPGALVAAGCRSPRGSGERRSTSIPEMLEIADRRAAGSGPRGPGRALSRWAWRSSIASRLESADVVMSGLCSVGARRGRGPLHAARTIARHPPAGRSPAGRRRGPCPTLLLCPGRFTARSCGRRSWLVTYLVTQQTTHRDGEHLRRMDPGGGGSASGSCPSRAGVLRKLRRSWWPEKPAAGSP